MFSCIVPTRDRGPQLEHCLRALLAQDFPATLFEIIVVDDGGETPVSTPSAWPAAGPALRILRIPHSGPAAARNAGAHTARFPWLAFTDDDCRPAPGWLSALAAAAEKNTQSLLGGQTVNGDTSNPFAACNHAIIDSLLEVTAATSVHFFPSNNIAIPAAAFSAIGGFDESFPAAAGEDRELCERWRRRGGSLTAVPSALVVHHHSQTLSSFLAMHRRYGAGAQRLAEIRAAESEHVNHVSLFRSLLPRLSTSGLLIFLLSQIAVATGYFGWTRQSLIRYSSCAAIFVATLLAAFYTRGAFLAEFGGPDEAAHVVSGLMVHQYLHDGLWNGQAPLEFAHKYYSHYPKVAIGHWPPGFYLIQALWLSLAGISRFSFLLLSAMIAASLGIFAVWMCRKEHCSWPLSASAGLATVAAPGIIAGTMEFMSDGIAALSILAAAVLCRFWLADLSSARALAFGAAAAAAVLAKGNAFALAFVPPLALAITARLRLLAQPRFWLPAVAVVVIAFPWYYLAWSISIAEIDPEPRASWLGRISFVARKNAWDLLNLAGVPITLLAAAAWRSIWPRWPSLLSVVPALFLFLTLVSPHSEQRLLLAAAPLICFAAAYRLRTLPPTLSSITLITCLAVAHWLTPVPMKPALGFVPAAVWARSHPTFLSHPVLVSSNAFGEGAWISELALHSPKPSSTTSRASKLLESSNWMGFNRRLLISRPSDVPQILASASVRSIVYHFDPASPESLHQPLLRPLLASWRREASFGNIVLYTRP